MQLLQPQLHLRAACSLLPLPAASTRAAGCQQAWKHQRQQCRAITSSHCCQASARQGSSWCQPCSWPHHHLCHPFHWHTAACTSAPQPYTLHPPCGPATGSVSKPAGHPGQQRVTRAPAATSSHPGLWQSAPAAAVKAAAGRQPCPAQWSGQRTAPSSDSDAAEADPACCSEATAARQQGTA